MKEYVRFNSEDHELWLEAEPEIEVSAGSQLLTRGGKEEAHKTESDKLDAAVFSKWLQGVKPLVGSVYNSLQELNSPTEIELEFGIKLAAKTGIIVTSAESEANFRVKLAWKNQ